ncbi:hypothetical protein FACS189413_06390 [Bacteroidia bacterium]|nr:hypothetical protein FACS189413_06390 [Bacteroidia bacterium]
MMNNRTLTGFQTLLGLKQQTTMKRTIILTIAILSASTLFAERNSFRDRSSNWLQRNNTTETRGAGLRAEGSAPTIDNDGDGPGNDPETPGPIGGGVVILCALGAGYSVAKRKRKA